MIPSQKNLRAESEKDRLRKLFSNAQNFLDIESLLSDMLTMNLLYVLTWEMSKSYVN